jgi:hypothetical protein
MINMQLASFVQRGTRGTGPEARDFNSKISYMMSHTNKMSQAANKKFEEMRREKPLIPFSPEKRPERHDTVESP